MRFQTNFVPISLTAQFKELPVEDFENFVNRDSLHVDEEDQVSNYSQLKKIATIFQVFEAVNQWIEHDPERTKYAERSVFLLCLPT